MCAEYSQTDDQLANVKIASVHMFSGARKGLSSL